MSSGDSSVIPRWSPALSWPPPGRHTCAAP